MNIIDYTHLLNKPNAVTEKQSLALDKVLDEFPYFQSARALRLKGLYNQNSFRYNTALKVTAAHTTDRAVLFDFISSDSFHAIQKELYEKKTNELLSLEVLDSVEIVHEKESESNKHILEEESVLVSTVEVPEVETKKETDSLEEKLEIGKPLGFTKNEKHSFQEWLELSKIQPIVRETENSPKTVEIDDAKKKKEALIDKFIETSPKISPIKPGTTITTVSFDINKKDNSSLMTETLAKVYLEQKKYQKAIQAYEILILKYPEKSSFFADRISDIKLLQQNNN